MFIRPNTRAFKAHSSDLQTGTLSDALGALPLGEVVSQRLAQLCDGQLELPCHLSKRIGVKLASVVVRESTPSLPFGEPLVGAALPHPVAHPQRSRAPTTSRAPGTQADP